MSKLTTKRLSAITKNVKLPFGWTSSFTIDALNANGTYQIEDKAGVCNVTGAVYPWRGRKWRLSQHMTDSEIVQTMMKAVLTAIEHEAREGFLYKGASIFDPHYNVDQLYELRKRDDALETRITLVAANTNNQDDHSPSSSKSQDLT